MHGVLGLRRTRRFCDDVRDALMSHCTGYACEVTDGETFEDWCLENVRKYYLPEGISVLAFIKEFEPELRAKYDKQAAEARE